LARVLIIGENPIFSGATKSLLNSSAYSEVNIKSNFAEARKTFSSYSLLIRLVERIGEELFNEIREVKNLWPHLGQVIYNYSSENPSGFAILQSLNFGALSFLSKEDGLEDFRSAARSTIKGIPYYTDSVAQLVHANIQCEHKPQIKPDYQHLLTPREYEVLACIVKGKTNKVIASDLCISVRTVEAHRDRVMKKMKVSCCAGLVAQALTSGLVQAS